MMSIEPPEWCQLRVGIIIIGWEKGLAVVGLDETTASATSKKTLHDKRRRKDPQ